MGKSYIKELLGRYDVYDGTCVHFGQISSFVDCQCVSRWRTRNEGFALMDGIRMPISNNPDTIYQHAMVNEMPKIAVGFFFFENNLVNGRTEDLRYLGLRLWAVVV
jgi:hypothetical protein